MKCPICGKSSRVYRTTKKLRGHKNPTGKRRRQPNLQWVTIPEDAKLPSGANPNLKGKRIKACTKCIKAIYAQAR